ncbi:MAG TPA: hypothetical protein PK559_07445 [Ignavibacteriaceae bacterium]|nr:hypothetical protein [Ignavibacteriaceae bacterium]
MSKQSVYLWTATIFDKESEQTYKSDIISVERPSDRELRTLLNLKDSEIILFCRIERTRDFVLSIQETIKNFDKYIFLNPIKFGA